MKRVSFDFDRTLSRKDVQSYAKDLIAKGVEVWILTSRFENPQHYSWWETNKDINHNDLFAVAQELGIPKSRIMFTNMEEKWLFFNRNKRLEFLFHLDDDPVELGAISRNTKVKAISCLSGTYRQKANNVLNL